MLCSFPGAGKTTKQEKREEKKKKICKREHIKRPGSPAWFICISSQKKRENPCKSSLGSAEVWGSCVEVRLGVATSTPGADLAEDNVRMSSVPVPSSSWMLEQDMVALSPPHLPGVSGTSWWVWLQRPNPNISPRSAVRGDFPCKEVSLFCMTVRKMPLGEHRTTVSQSVRG